MSYLGDCPCGVPRTKSGFKGLNHNVPSDDETAQKCKEKSSVIESTGRQLAECRTETRNADGVWHYCTLPYRHEGPHIFSARSPIDAEAAQQYAGSLGTNMLQVGPDQPIETNANGSKQSALPYRFDLLDSKAMFRLAAIRYYGTDIRGYTPDNWRGISAESHVNHALSHLMAWIGGDKQDDHLGHAFCRLMFAVGVEEAGK